MTQKVTRAQTQSEWEQEMGNRILDYSKTQLYLDLPFMDLALSALTPIPNPSLLAIATNGICLYYAPEHLIRVFQKNEQFLERAYLHSILHCIYAHLWIRGKRDSRIWNLACDIAVEMVIDGLNHPTTKRAVSWIRQQLYEELKNKQIVSASEIYLYLQNKVEPSGSAQEQPVHTHDMQEIVDLEREFFTDDHRYWPMDEDKKRRQSQASQQEAQKKWNQLSRQMQMKQKKDGKDPKEGEQLLLSQIQAQRSRRSYQDFLRKFARLQEEMKCDPDEFDLSYYTFGLEHFGNMPLIEPLESKEMYKIRDFVIVTDTSYSTSGELVHNFLEETFSILKQQQNFFRGGKVHIIQCDDQVRNHTVITSEKDIDTLIREFALHGGGNTDFRPAFTYVNELIEQGDIRNPGGLLYFTDGKGQYPKKKPSYRTAFLFLDDYEEDRVPPWAMRLKLEKEEFKRK